MNPFSDVHRCRVTSSSVRLQVPLPTEMNLDVPLTRLYDASIQALV